MARPIALVLCLFLVSGLAQGRDVAPPDPALEKRVIKLSEELRCLVCQNQTIADSNAELAVDLRNQVREQLSQGRTEAQILKYMADRYGDFVLYRPPVKSATALLWFGPAGLVLCGFTGLALYLKKRRSLATDDDPDQGLPDEYDSAPAAPPNPPDLPNPPNPPNPQKAAA